MTNLAAEVQTYLSANGIKHNFFSEKIGITSRKCSRWFAGLENLTVDERDKAEKFLEGSWLRAPNTEGCDAQ